MIKKQQKKGADEVKVTFVLPAEEVTGKTSVVGDFNAWDPTKTRFVRRANGTYSVSVKVETGNEYGFRYYGEDGTWSNDDAADKQQMNIFGSLNSVVLT